MTILLPILLLSSVRLGTAQARIRLRRRAGLLDGIWEDVERVQTQLSNGCGALTETRTSPLLARPMVLTGRFCMAGTDRFRLDYAPPNPVRIIYNDGALNVSLDGGLHTEAFEVGQAVERTQGYFSGPRARQNLEHDFEIMLAEVGDHIELSLRPVAGRVAKRVTRVVVEFTRDFLPRRLEIAGRNGVNSRFEIRMTEPGATIDEAMFKVYRPGPARNPPPSTDDHDGHRD